MEGPKYGIARIALLCIFVYLTLCMYARTRWEHRIRGGYCQRCGFQYETCMVTTETCAHMCGGYAWAGARKRTAPYRSEDD